MRLNTISRSIVYSLCSRVDKFFRSLDSWTDGNDAQFGRASGQMQCLGLQICFFGHSLKFMFCN